jgi:DNA repair protein RadA/Sms
MLDKDKVVEIRKQLNEAEYELHKEEPLLLRTMNQCIRDARLLPPSRKIFGILWQTGEVTILCGETGKGKSLLAMLIGIAISDGKLRKLVDQEMEVTGTVLYFDFELSDRNILKRYDGYCFSDNFYRVTINEKYLGDFILTNDFINYYVEKTGAEYVILDNIIALSLRSAEDGNVAREIMRNLKRLSRMGLSVLVLAHVPKIPTGIKLHNNHIAGSKVLINLHDSAFFIAQSTENQNYRYIKQTKCRDGEEMQEVIIVEINKKEGFVGFDFVRYDDEENHIGTNEEIENEKINEAIKLFEAGKTYRDISKLTGMKLSTLGRKLKAYKESKTDISKENEVKNVIQN